MMAWRQHGAAAARPLWELSESGPRGATVQYGGSVAQMSSEGRLTADGFVGYPHGLTWEHQWFKTSLYLGRLRQIYAADPVNNIDLMGVVDAFMISCAHMWDAFQNDARLPSITKAEVDQPMKAVSSLRLCRDYANTAKHLKRRHANDIGATVLEAGTNSSGKNFVTIGYGPAANPRQSTADALIVADAAYEAWQRFMREHSIEDPVTVNAGLLNPPAALHNESQDQPLL